MEPYNHNLEVEPYIFKTKEELDAEFDTFKDSTVSSKYNYKTTQEFVTKWYGYKLDSNNNAVSTNNPNALWDYYEIGGQWNGYLTDKSSSSQANNNKKKLEENCVSVKDVLNKYYDGKYSCQIVDKDKRFLGVSKKILRDNIEDYIVNIDYYHD